MSISSGSGEILNVSVRHGCSPKARQIRSTLDAEIPTFVVNRPRPELSNRVGHFLKDSADEAVKALASALDRADAEVAGQAGSAAGHRFGKAA
ncbi:hypothetical protein ACH4E7_33000 [Kitasatospora sp. NPDC018058]|uniref:hypothetical protein n=1 Tax=Kitasatospora sp. NPDC018058 TaxID=3364025 RepID=UPI0037C0CAC8